MKNYEVVRVPVRGKHGFSTRGYLPHLEVVNRPQFITFRLADSLPGSIMERISDEVACCPENQRAREAFKKIEKYLDLGLGNCCLSEPAVAAIVEDCVMYFNGIRYSLHAWCIMPNHVHVLITPDPLWPHRRIASTWKSYSARKINKLRNTEGDLWQRECFDRYTRNEAHFERIVNYIENNPVTAQLVRMPHEWHFSSARTGSLNGRGTCGERS